MKRGAWHRQTAARLIYQRQDKTLVPLFTAYGRAPITGSDGKPLLVELSTLQAVSAGRSLRLTLRPLIDAFSGQNELANPDPAANGIEIVPPRTLGA